MKFQELLSRYSDLCTEDGKAGVVRNGYLKERWIYLWVDGIYSGLRTEDAKLCTLLVIGVSAPVADAFARDRIHCALIPMMDFKA